MTLLEKIKEIADIFVTGMQKIDKIQRYSHESEDDGDGYSDEWEQESESGEWVKWADIEDILKALNGKDSE